MRHACAQDKDRIIEYLSKDIDNCVYLYIDINTCDICSENITVWLNEKETEIDFVVMKYYDSLQIYSRNKEIDVSEIVELVEQYKVSMISGPKQLIELLEKRCERYYATYGEVFQFYAVPNEPDLGIGVRATEEDASGIAELLMSDSDFAVNYELENLTRQFADRIRLKQGRSYIIKVDGNVVAHTATFAEASDVAVLSGAVVKKEYRKTDYFSIISSYINWELAKEGKKLYAFVINKKMIKWMNYTARNCGQYGKLVKK